MNIFDLDKNSLPEQVQINKENIATLMTDPTTKQYVDDQDAATLQSAKDYTDNHMVNAGHITSGASVAGKVLTSNGDSTASWKNPTVDTIDAGTSTSGQVIASNGDGTASWQTPSTTITASDVDSETATAGQVLAADGNGGASWQNAGGGGLNLKWEGSFSISGSEISMPYSLENGKKYLLLYENPTSNVVSSSAIFVFSTSTATYLTIVSGADLETAFIYLKITTTNTIKRNGNIVKLKPDMTMSTAASNTNLRAIYEV